MQKKLIRLSVFYFHNCPAEVTSSMLVVPAVVSCCFELSAAISNAALIILFLTASRPSSLNDKQPVLCVAPRLCSLFGAVKNRRAKAMNFQKMRLLASPVDAKTL